MKRMPIFLILSTLFLTAPVFAQTTSYKETEKTYTFEAKIDDKASCGLSHRPIRLVGFVTNPPLGWKETTSYSRDYSNGFGLTLFEKIAEDLGYKTLNTAGESYHDAIMMVKRNRADILLGTYYDPQIQSGLQLIYPSFIGNPFIIVFMKGKEKPITSFNDLKGLKGVVRQEELIYPLIFKSLPAGVDMTQVSGARTAYAGLVTGEYDYLFTGLYNAETEIRRFKLMDDTVITETPLVKPELFFAIGNNSPCKEAVEKISEKIRELKNDAAGTQKMLIALIDEWGKRFADDPSLIEQLNPPAELETTPETQTTPEKPSSDAAQNAKPL